MNNGKITLWEMALEREKNRVYMEKKMEKRYNYGYKNGIRDALQAQIIIKYGQDESDWLESLTAKQLERVSKEILKDITLDGLKNKVETKAK
ncbi:hypothetical protein [Thomasclavelia sp.]|uniref:hypothetical protein n=1 Tax=Thomasclavelia sp. TaxID=3025757 RepID=UPI0025F103AC|nr:hypothetical protein [Thomasclavelia sp.]